MMLNQWTNLLIKGFMVYADTQCNYHFYFYLALDQVQSQLID